MKAKVLACFLALVLALSCCPLRAAAEPEDAGAFDGLPLRDVPGCVTVVTDLEGVAHTFPGCLDVTALESDPRCEAIASYSIRLDGAVLLEVTLHDILPADLSLQGSGGALTNGYYAVQFDLDEEQEAFLTGLTPENLDRLQQDILDAGLAGQDVSFEDIDFIDTEKVESLENLEHREDSDADLCWAAAASNVLHYTGWGEQAGFGSTDYLFDLFTTRFSDGSGMVDFALSWFLNGYYEAQYYDAEDLAIVDDGSYGSFTGYFPRYSVESVTRTLNLVDSKEGLTQAADALRDGWGAGLSVGYYEAAAEERLGGHAITLWGYARSKSDPHSFSYLVVSDSDNDIYGAYENRRAAPNTLQALGLTTSTLGGGESWALSDYQAPSGVTFLVDKVTLLAPWSPDLPQETEGDGNRFTHPDLKVQEVGVDTVAGSKLYDRQILPAGEELFVCYNVINSSGKSARTFPVRVRVEKDGVLCRTAEAAFPYALDPVWYGTADLSIGPLDPGEYTVTFTVDPDRRQKEASYGNNTRTLSVTVVPDDPVGDLAVTLGDMGVREDGSVGATAELTRPGDCPADGARFLLFAAYGHDGEITGEWEQVYSGSAFPREVFTPRDISSSQVYYRLLVSDNDPARPWREYRSQAVDQAYRLVVPHGAPGNTEELTPRPQGSTDCAPGEGTRFAFYNGSQVPGSLPFRWELTARGEISGQSYCLAAGEAELAFDELSDVFTNTSLEVIDPATGTPTGTLPADGYLLTVTAFYQDPTGEEEAYSTDLGVITITPVGDLPRAGTGEPVTVGRTRATVPVSVRTEPGSSIRLGVEFSTDRDFAVSAVLWVNEDWTVCDDGLAAAEHEILPLLPETTYYYRAVVEVQGQDGLVPGENVETLTTGRAVLQGTLTLDEEQTYSLPPAEYTYFLFTAPETGWYCASASGGDLFNGFAEGDDVWYFGNEGTATYQDGTASFTAFVPAGRRMCVSVGAVNDADCTLKVTEVRDAAGYALGAPALTDEAPGRPLVTVPFTAPLGSSFTLGVEYGPDEASLTTASEEVTDCRQTEGEVTLILDCLPGQTYLYRVFLRDAETGEGITGDFQTVDLAPFDATALEAGEKTFSLDRDGTRFFTYTAERKGTCTLRVSGPDGVVAYWDEGWQREQFTLNGTTLTLPLDKGETGYFGVMGYLPGDYHLSLSFAGGGSSGGGGGGGAASYPIAVSDGVTGGAVTVSPQSAQQGKTVTVTLTPQEGYEASAVTVTDAKGNPVPVTENADGTYSFTMPAGAVTVKAEFTETDTPDDPAPAGRDVSDRFTDVTREAWYHDPVQWAVDSGLMKGVSEDAFAPNGDTTRAMVVTMLWRLAGEPAASAPAPFSDVSGEAWYADAVAWAAETGAVNGTGGDTFSPNVPVTREQLAAILYRYAQAKGQGFTGDWAFLLDYPDAGEVSRWADEAMHWMTMHGVLTGMGDGTLAPKANATRAQIAAMFQRFAETMEA